MFHLQVIRKEGGEKHLKIITCMQKTKKCYIYLRVMMN